MYLGEGNIVRHNLVQKIIIACEQPNRLTEGSVWQKGAVF
jgi:hypothetical protein